MIDLVEFIWNWSFSVISLFFHLFQVLSKTITTMAVSSTTHPPTPASSPLPWKRFQDSPFTISKRSRSETHADQEFVPGGGVAVPVKNEIAVLPREELMVNSMLGMDSLSTMGEAKVVPGKVRKRPARIVIPEAGVSGGSGFGGGQVVAVVEKDLVNRDFEVEGCGYALASRRGNRQVMEDGYDVISNINGDTKQAYFGVFDGHGGRAAVDFVSEKLGKNIITAFDQLKKEDNHTEMAITEAYLTTDREFLSKGEGSGTCAATVLFKDGDLHIANVGDCRVVMSRDGVVNVLTSDHRAEREDERLRIEKSGGYVNCHNGVWRVQKSLAVSRAIGDLHMKDWIISSPETRKLTLTSDCEFLIMASDGLWDKVTNQEAVDVVSRHKDSFLSSCKELVDISSSRGSRDDITVMVVDLQKYVQ